MPSHGAGNQVGLSNSRPFLPLRFGKGEKVTGQERKNKLECSRGWRATFQHQNALRACPLPPPSPCPDLRPTHLNLQGVGQGQQLDSLYLKIGSRKGTLLLLPSCQSQGDSDSILTKVPKLLVFGALEAPEQCSQLPPSRVGQVPVTHCPLALLTHRGSPWRGPIMARNRGCCRRAKSALTRDCSPVRLPNWVEGYLQGQQTTCHRKAHSQAFQMLLASAWPQVRWCQRRGRNSLREQRATAFRFLSAQQLCKVTFSLVPT